MDTTLATLSIVQVDTGLVALTGHELATVPIVQADKGL
jgi:hypothetical protein